MRTISKFIAILPWWVAELPLRLHKMDPDYDYRTVDGRFIASVLVKGYIIRRVCWLLLLAGIILLLWGFPNSIVGSIVSNLSDKTHNE